MYIIIRMIIGIILLFVLWTIIRKAKIAKKKLLLVLSFIGVMILTSLSALAPIENYFIDFSTPEKAFRYSTIGSIDKIVEGEQSVLILYKTSAASSLTVFAKGDKGWKIGTYFSYRTLVNNKTVDRRIINIYNARNTDDYYVTVWDPLATEVVEITDNKGGNFEYIEEENKATSTKNITYYSYVKNITEGYTLTIAGNQIKIY